MKLDLPPLGTEAQTMGTDFDPSETMVTRTARPLFLVLSMLCATALSGIAHAADARDQASDPAWYFVGGTDTVESEAELDDPARGPRYEFSFTFGENRDDDVLRFTSGQSYGISGGQQVYTFLVNRTFDWQNDSPITPHFMAGLGLSYFDPDNITGPRALTEADSWKPAFQVGVGATYEASANWAFTAHYRAFYVGEDPVSAETELDGTLSQQFMIGARLRF